MEVGRVWSIGALAPLSGIVPIHMSAQGCFRGDQGVNDHQTFMALVVSWGSEPAEVACTAWSALASAALNCKLTMGCFLFGIENGGALGIVPCLKSRQIRVLPSRPRGNPFPCSHDRAIEAPSDSSSSCMSGTLH